MSNDPIQGTITPVAQKLDFSDAIQMPLVPSSVFLDSDESTKKTDIELLPEAVIQNVKARAVHALGTSGLDPDKLEYYLWTRARLGDPIIRAAAAHPDLDDIIYDHWLEIPWHMDYFFSGNAARQLIYTLDAPRLLRAFNPKNSGMIKARIWRKSIGCVSKRDSMRRSVSLFYHPNGGSTGSACTGNQYVRTPEQMYTVFHKNQNYRSPNMSGPGLLFAEPIRIELSLAGASGRPYRFDFSEMKEKTLDKFWTMAHCAGVMRTSANTYNNRTSLQQMINTVIASSNFFEKMKNSGCSRCPMNCALRNSLASEPGSQYVPQLASPWISRPSSRASQTRLPLLGRRD